MTTKKKYKARLETILILKEELKNDLPQHLALYKRARLAILERGIELSKNRAKKMLRKKRIRDNMIKKQAKKYKKVYKSA